MTKWIWAICGVVALTVLVVVQRGGTKSAYVNGLAEYNTLPNKEYIFQRDCYIFKDQDRGSSFPFVGANAPELSISVADLPKEITEANIGLKNKRVRILDIVRTGTRFKIVSVRRDQTRESTTISFEILILGDEERKYPRLDTYFILNHAPEKTGAAPEVETGYAVERVKL